MKSVYQVEYSMSKEGDVWYNFSSLDGEPFVNERRFLKVEDWCTWMFRNKGQRYNRCDWPFHEGRRKANDAGF